MLRRVILGRPLNGEEKQWINKLLSVDFMGKAILQRQLDKAKVILYEEYSFVYLKFFVEDSIEKFPYKIRVPVEMRVFQKDLAPVQFFLHVINGYIDELEILMADSSKLDIDSINFERVEYDINEELMV
jgi:hypothetical protein